MDPFAEKAVKPASIPCFKTCVHVDNARIRLAACGLEESQQKSDWVRADFADFEGQ
ncbi:MAG: hypothetical protein ABIR00_06720 [Nitrosospira sp.]